MKEQQLMDDFRAGDESSFTFIFNEMYPALCLFAFRITADQSAAEDIVSEAFVKIWKRKDNFSIFKVLRAYLYTTVRNASINWRLHYQRQRTNENNIILNTVGTNIEENIIRAETFRSMYTALSLLPPQCRRIISMIYIEGKNSREVAEELNLAVGTVKTQKARGLMLLKKRLPIFIFLLINILLR